MNPHPSSRPSKKSLLQTSVAALDLTKAFRARVIPQGSSNDLGVVLSETALAGQKGVALETKPNLAPSSATSRLSINREESGSKLDPVHSVQGPKQTRSPSVSSSESGLKRTESVLDRVQPGPSPKQTGSNLDPVSDEAKPRVRDANVTETGQKNRLPVILKSHVLAPKDNFKAIPNYLLIAEECPFEDANDFQIYLRLFAKSFGFGRNTCDMGITELVTFTRMGKNTVKRSMERLAKQGWIKMIGDFEPGQIARKWRVYLPWEKGLTPEPTYGRIEEEKPREANSNPVQNGPSPNSSPTGSITDSVTGSNLDPYRNNKRNNLRNNSLSGIPENLREYFDELKPQRKRESELLAFRELQKDFSDQDIADCLDLLQREGLSSGEMCHSPMGYLARAMSEVLARVRSEQEIRRRALERANAAKLQAEAQAEQEKRENAEWARCEAAFRKAHPTPELEQEAIARLCAGLPFSVGSTLGRAAAIRRWWEGNERG